MPPVEEIPSTVREGLTTGGQQLASPWFQVILQHFAQYPWLGMLLLLMLIDVFTGIAAAVVQRKLSSKVGYRGMMRKTSVLLVIGMAAIVEQAMRVSLPESLKGLSMIPIAKLAAAFFLINECLSILENARLAGVPLPAFLSKSLVETLDKISHFGHSHLRDDKHQEAVALEIKEAKIKAVVKTEPEDAPDKPL